MTIWIASNRGVTGAFNHAYRQISSYLSEMEPRASLILTSNQVAMSKLHSCQYSAALSLLQKAQALAQASDQVPLQSLTFNNLGCYYYRRKQPKVALRYLQRALALDMSSEAGEADLAGTNLNLCVMYSQAGRHAEALVCVQTALKLLNQSGKALNCSDSSVATNRVIAHHNLGAELEYLGQLPAAIEAYTAGQEIAQRELGPGHSLTTSLTASANSASCRFRTVHNFTELRRSRRESARVPSHVLGKSGLESSFLSRRSPRLKQVSRQSGQWISMGVRGESQGKRKTTGRRVVSCSPASRV